jgi:hypothetical protein
MNSLHARILPFFLFTAGTLLLAMPHFARAQASAAAPKHYTHSTFWHRTSLQYNVGQRWSIVNEYQHRRQDTPLQEGNMFQHDLLHSYRLWVNYRLPQTWTLTVSPFTYFHNTPLRGSKADMARGNEPEFRFTGMIEARNKAGRFEIVNRIGYENRWIKRLPETSYRPVGRFRIRLMAELPVWKDHNEQYKARLYLSEEVFLRAGKEVLPTQYLEHNRLTTGIRYTVNPYLRIDSGYQYAYRVRRNGFETDGEHTVFLNAFFTLNPRK